MVVGNDDIDFEGYKYDGSIPLEEKLKDESDISVKDKIVHTLTNTSEEVEEMKAELAAAEEDENVNKNLKEKGNTKNRVARIVFGVQKSHENDQKEIDFVNQIGALQVLEMQQKFEREQGQAK